MKAPVHILAGLAALSFLPDAVFASSTGKYSPWFLAAFAAVLPDFIETLLSLLKKNDATLTPEPSKLANRQTGELANRQTKDILDALSSAMETALTRQHALRLLVRPLPPTCGVLRLRFLTGRVEASILPLGAKEDELTPTSSPVASAPLPVARGPWPATVEVAHPWGVVLRFAPSPHRKPPAVDVRVPSSPGRGVFHSPILLLGIPLAGFLWLTSSLPIQAICLGLLSHGLLDGADSRGLPWRNPFQPGIGFHLWRDESRLAGRLLTLATATLLLCNLIRHTAYIPRRNSLLGYVLLAAATVLLFLAPRIGYTKRR